MKRFAPDVSIVVCTFDRLDLLRRTLSSCLVDATRQALNYEIVVSDNSTNGYARELVAGMAEAGLPVRWVAAEPPNISVARNVGLNAAAAPLIAFLDDDLVVTPGWLDSLVTTLERSGADVAIGPVHPLFVTGTPPTWDREARRFTRDLPYPSGADIRTRARPKKFAISTASSIWRRSTCFLEAEPFDRRFGRCGGEDLDLFLRLERLDRRVVWCAEAGVEELVPASRTRLGYQLLRAYSGGQTYALATIHNAADTRRTASWIMIRGMIQIVFVALSFGVAPLEIGHLRSRAITRMLNLASAAGKVLWFRTVPLYRIEASEMAREAAR